MKFSVLKIDEIKKAQGTVVVIDVLRAFTTAAFAFNAGVREIVPVKNIKGMWEWKKRGYLLAGENRGKKVPGFDFGNSPTEFINVDLHTKLLALRTSLGTKGIMDVRTTSPIFAASLVVAKATVNALQTAKSVTFILTGSGDDDLAAAEYMIAKLQGSNAREVCARVRNAGIQNFSHYPSLGEQYLADVEAACRINCFPFAMKFCDGILKKVPDSKQTCRSCPKIT